MQDCRSQHLRLLKLNIKARHYMQELLSPNLFSIFIVALDIDWSCDIFSLHNFCSMLIEQLIEIRRIENVRIENLKFRTDLQD